MACGPSLARARRATAALAAAVAALVAAPAASAEVLVGHHSTTVAETAGNNDGLVGPGDSFSIVERLLSADTQPGHDPLTGVSGTVSTTTPGVTLGQTTSPYPDLPFGLEQANTTPFSATLGPGVDCGINVDFTMALTTAQGSATVPFTVPTGTAGPSQALDSADVPRVIPDLANISSNLQVGSGHRVKEVRVRIPRLTHTHVGDLTLELIAPDGTAVTLMSRRGESTDNLVNVTFSDAAGQSIGSATPPFANASYRPEEPLSELVGRARGGTWKLRVFDEQGGDSGTLESWGIDLRSAVCDGSPQASFTATPNPALPGAAVSFDASESTDPNGTIVQYEWDFDGNGVYDQTTTTPTTTHTYANRGLYQAKLRVTDDTTPTAATGTVVVPVSITQPPTADFTVTPPSPFTGESVTLDGSASSDPDGTIVRYEWDLDGDGTFERDGGTTATTTTTFANPGTRPVRLRVTDQDGATGVKAVDVTVQNRPPTASFTAPSPAIVGTPALFDGSGSSDPDGTVTRYEWDLDGDGTFETDTGSNPQATRTYTASADLSVKLRVTDDSGVTATHTRSVRVTRAPVAAFSANPNPVSLGVAVSFVSTSSDPDGQPIARHEWDLDGDGTFETDGGTVPTASRSYGANGTYAVKLRVTDADGATATRTVDVVASNGLPTALLSASPNPAVAGSPVQLDATASSDPDGTLVKFEWDLDGNGSYEVNGGTNPVRGHTYPTPGTLDVGVRVTDNHGGTATRTLTLVVAAPGGGEGGGTGGEPGGGGGAEPGPTGGGAAGSSPTGGPGAAPTGGAGAAGPAARLSGNPVQRLAAVLSRGLVLACQVNRPLTCVLRAELRPGDARRLGLGARVRRPVVVGTLRLVVSGGSRQGRLRLTAAGRRALRRTRRVNLVVRGTALGGGVRVPLARTFLVRR